MEEEISKGRHILIVGDFNCRIGDRVPGNDTMVTKGGKMLNKLMERYNLRTGNETSKCAGLWTRSENKSRAVLDYLIMKQEDLEYLETMQIDEEKNECPLFENNKWHQENSIFRPQRARGNT